MSYSDYLDSKPYQPDPFQIEAAEAISRGGSVVVTAPTGAGKTLIAEVAVHLGLERGRRVFYTTPIKALSNQKFSDLCDEHGRDSVGLLTGDNVINANAPVVVMTTEVLRNMIYADPEGLADVGFVVLDEVHYLQDRFRGAVWEEVIIHAPRHLQLVCLSATVANAKQFTNWIEERRGRTRLVQTSERPVPLEPMYLLNDRMGEGALRMFSMFTNRDGKTRRNPKLEQLLGLERGRRNRFGTPKRLDVVEHLADAEMLPAIFFIFSRAGCSAAALSMVESGIRLIGKDARESVRRIAEERTAHLSDSDLSALEYGRFLAGLQAGVAAHHAGMVPAFKETVEELFKIGLLKVVFATETLALGINMPARTVVLESLSKFDGEGHSLLEPGDFTQLTGRAGRRGIDVHGYGVVLHSRFEKFPEIARIAEAGSHPLTSSFRPTYNMAANLVANYPQERAEELLNASFAQFLRMDRDDTRSRTLAEMEDRLDDENVRSDCHLGDLASYVALIEEGKTSQSRTIVGRIHPGDVLAVPSGAREGRFLVLRRLTKGKKNVRFLVMSTAGRTTNIGDRDLVAGTVTMGRINLPQAFRPGDRSFQQDMLKKLRKFKHMDPPKELTQEQTLDHPVAGCAQAADHVRWYRKARRTERRIEQLRRELRSHGVGLVAEFRAIENLLGQWGYLDGWHLTPRGDRLRFVYNELDLLLTECVERGVLWSLEPRDLAAVLSCFVFEPRTDVASEPHWPTEEIEKRFQSIIEIWDELSEAERIGKLVQTRRPDAGFVALAYQWAGGADLDDLANDSLAPGDFVRVSRQLVDLTRQVRDTFAELRPEATAVLGLVERGVVQSQISS